MADSEQVLAVSEISYRRLDYWTTQGYLRAEVANPGTGNRRSWSRQELGIAALMRRLVDAGLLLGRAAEVARAVVTGAAPHGFTLAPGIHVVVAEVPPLTGETR